MGLGFCEPLKLAKGGPWVWRAFGESTRDAFVQDFGETHQGRTLGLMSLVCVPRVLCSFIHVVGGVACTGVIVSCSCIHVTHGVAYTRVIVSCSCIRVTCRMARTGDVVACSCICVTYGMARIGDAVVCFCICVTVEWYVLDTRWHALANMSLVEWYVPKTWWRALAYMSLVRWHVLETWCSCIHGTCEVARTRNVVLLHTCHLWGSTYWRLGARKRAHQGRSLGLKCLWSCNHGCTCLDKKIMKKKGVEFSSGN